MKFSIPLLFVAFLASFFLTSHVHAADWTMTSIPSDISAVRIGVGDSYGVGYEIRNTDPVRWLWVIDYGFAPNYSEYTEFLKTGEVDPRIYDYPVVPPNSRLTIHYSTNTTGIFSLKSTAQTPPGQKLTGELQFRGYWYSADPLSVANTNDYLLGEAGLINIPFSVQVGVPSLSTPVPSPQVSPTPLATASPGVVVGDSPPASPAVASAQATPASSFVTSLPTIRPLAAANEVAPAVTQANPGAYDPTSAQSGSGPMSNSYSTKTEISGWAYLYVCAIVILLSGITFLLWKKRP